MSSRLDICFAALKVRGCSGLVVYLTAGDPNYNLSLELLNTAAEAGADVIEIGLPFSDPVADGTVIQGAHKRALAAGQTVTKTLEILAAWRKRQPEVPAVLMGYLNPIMSYGLERFFKDAVAAGADGLILVDLPYEHALEYRVAAQMTGLCLIQMVAQMTDQNRQALILDGAEGFVYQVMLNGTTGVARDTPGDMAAKFAEIRRHTAVPIAAGFGIQTPEQAGSIALMADLVVVGSELIRRIHDSPTPQGALIRCADTVRQFSAAVASART